MTAEGMTVDEMIKGLKELENVEDSDRLYMFVQLCDHKVIMERLKHHAIMVKMGMGTQDPVYDLMYGIMKLVHPYLFEESG